MTIEGNKINITTKQEIQEMGGVRTIEFTQQHSLPSDAQGNQIQKTITQEGELVITAPRGERVEKPARQSKLSRSTTIPITIEERPNQQKKSLLTPEQSPVPDKAKNVKKAVYNDFDYD